MFKAGVFLLYGAFTHLIAVLVFTQFLMLEKLKAFSSVSGGVDHHIPPLFWKVFYIEVSIAIVLMVLPFFLPSLKKKYDL